MYLQNTIVSLIIITHESDYRNTALTIEFPSSYISAMPDTENRIERGVCSLLSPHPAPTRSVSADFSPLLIPPAAVYAACHHEVLPRIRPWPFIQIGALLLDNSIARVTAHACFSAFTDNKGGPRTWQQGDKEEPIRHRRFAPMADHEVVQAKSSWIWGWFSWSGSSSAMLRAAEKKILSCLKTAYRGWFVDIGPVVGPADKIWTISLNEESPKVPIVLLHGLGAGVALWCLNLDALASQRPVYAIDLLGFGRSSRPVFSNEAQKAEEQLVRSVEEWRREMQLENFVLLGHSMGGFLAASYAMQYPERVKHLILADPWGFPERPSDVVAKTNIPFWVKAIAFAVQPLNPLWAVRVAGPFGQWLIEKTRPDIVKKFSPVLKDDTAIISQYIHQCNAQTPSGESAFHAMMQGFGWAKNPIVKRMDKLSENIPITLLYGSRSWVDNSAGETIKQYRPSSYVNVQVITGAGHHVYADKSETFNKYVLEACALSDSIPHLTSLHLRPYTKPIDNEEIDVNLTNETGERNSEEKNLNTSESTGSKV